MAYQLHIERPPASDPEPIPFEEWKEAVERVEGIRLEAIQQREGRNPFTGEVVTFKARPGSVEMFVEAENTWVPIFLWHEGSISFRAPRQYPDPIWKAAASLAALLGAEIRGDEGEAYNPATGEMI